MKIVIKFLFIVIIISSFMIFLVFKGKFSSIGEDMDIVRDVTINVGISNYYSKTKIYNYLHHDNFCRENCTLSLGSNGDNLKDMSYIVVGSKGNPTCGILDNEAYVISYAGNVLAIRDAYISNGTIDFNISSSEAQNIRGGAGIAFRIKDVNNFLCIRQCIDSIRISKFEDGKITDLKYVYVAKNCDRIDKISVEFKENMIVLIIDGIKFGTVYSDFNVKETKYGLFFSEGTQSKIKHISYRIEKDISVSSDILDSGITPFWIATENCGKDYSREIIDADTNGSALCDRLSIKKADGYKRSELRFQETDQLSEQWIDFDIKLCDDYLVLDPLSECICQFHDTPENRDWNSENAKLSPNIALFLKNGKYIVHQQSDGRKNVNPKTIEHKEEISIGDYLNDVNKWVHWSWHIKWSYDSFFNPITELYKNGEIVYYSEKPNTVNATHGTFWKVGCYQWNYQDNPNQCNSISRTLLVDNIKITS